MFINYLYVVLRAVSSGMPSQPYSSDEDLVTYQSPYGYVHSLPSDNETYGNVHTSLLYANLCQRAKGI